MYKQLLANHYKEIHINSTITSLWSGCGEIVRCNLDGIDCVIKAIAVPDHINHSRISQTQFAINRKRRSYDVEYYWYQHYAQSLPAQSPALSCFNTLKNEHQRVLVFSDFECDGFAAAEKIPSHINAIIKWLAYFHAVNFQQRPLGLWPQGNYWHLDTRPDEYEKISDAVIKQKAQCFDREIRNCEYQTLIHGDAKLANFAVGITTAQALGYDFQYVGGGVGVTDLMYFLGSCLTNTELEQASDDYLAKYFDYFTQAMHEYHRGVDASIIVDNWRALWPVVWADFYRFLLGWSPNHVKINNYMQEQYQALDTY
ncbi:oxidoreductase family protein [Pseudoalteromonas sp. Ld20]|uniref:oxidoreductase family protein n=1 Tax=Pseudoalteromonas sp. Ld20 TaxID=649165 RepID=UPI00386D3218